MGVISLPFIAEISLPPLVITLLYQVVLSTGTQSITVNRNTRRSNGSDKDKAVQQQYIIEY